MTTESKRCEVCDGKIEDIPYQLNMTKKVNNSNVIVYEVDMCRKCGQKLEKKIKKIFERSREII